ncbi:MAG: class I SAM-dependent methyltransferase [Gammaproteobacteria bacterium]
MNWNHNTQSPPESWLPEDLENRACCPVCGSEQRRILHDTLEDRLFGAPGCWTLWQCLRCSSGWLDPNPRPQAIGKAYTDYLTHSAPPAEVRLVRQAPLWRIKQAAVHDLLNRSLGYRLHPALPLPFSRLILSELRQRQTLNRIRHLPPPGSDAASLLDVGCGNGSFLRVAQHLGYRAIGCEPDPRAAAAARTSGCEIYESSLPCPPLTPDSFDHITVAHVIEHLHDPLALLRECRTLLRPGGRLWIQTPNLLGLGHAFWGRDWRGLEPPRHLVLFTPDSLLEALRMIGFAGSRLLPSPPEAREIYRHSLAIRQGVNIRLLRKPRLDHETRRAARRADRTAVRDPTAAEAITAVAWRRDS